MHETKREKTSPNKAPESLSPAKLAQRWGCCRQTIYNMINDDELHSFTVRGCRRIPFSEIERVEAGNS